MNYIWIIDSNSELFLCSRRYLCWNTERIRTDELDQLQSNQIRYESCGMTLAVPLSSNTYWFHFIWYHRYHTKISLLHSPNSPHRSLHFANNLWLFEICLPVYFYVRVVSSVNLKSFRDKSYECGYTWIYMNMLVSLFQKWPKSFSNRSKSFGSNSKETSFGFSIFN